MSVEEEEEEDLNMYAEQDSAGIGQEETLEAVEDDRHARPGGEVTNYEDGTSDGTYNAEEINEHVFEELRLPYGVVQQVQDAWDAYLRSAESIESAGETLYASIFDMAPNLQMLFKTPRAVMATRLLKGVSSIVSGLKDAKDLKVIAETLGFMHLDYEVTAPRAMLFRDAIVEVVVMELGPRCSDVAVQGLKTALSYVGGALIYIRRNYADRLRILSTSWVAACKRSAEGQTTPGDVAETVERPSSPRSPRSSPRGDGGKGKRKRHESGSGTSDRKRDRERNIGIPATFSEMFRFNATVMGFADCGWMEEVLRSFDEIVCNVANTYRLQEACDILVLRLSKYRRQIELADFKAVMLASLRSLVPQSWDSEHEDAWSWLWRNVERMLLAQVGKPARQEKALTRMFTSLDGQDKSSLRQQVYGRFFEIAPAGMTYFKQSTTRLHFVADKVAAMTLDMFKDPDGVVDELSASGLRHVGYGVPAELCAPFVCAYVGILRKVVDDQEAADAFEWSLSLISRILARVINEGSTMVMRAINANSARQLSKAVACAPRADRSMWVLNVSVGSQSISPLLWAIETGSLEAAEAILKDLLTIRADRDRYYFGADALFQRHPDIIRRLCIDAPRLLPTLLDGLIWRSRLSEGGRRRVVYFAKHLIIRDDGGFSNTIEWITQHQDPRVVCHVIVSQVIDLVWTKIAARAFLSSKALIMLATLLYVISQAVLSSEHMDTSSIGVRIVVLCCRGFVYLFGWPRLLMWLVNAGRADIHTGKFMQIWCLKAPARFLQLDAAVRTILCIVLTVMVATEPILHCAGTLEAQDLMFTDRCDLGDELLEVYHFFSMCGLFCHFFLLVDLSVFSNRLSAFSLIFRQLVSELALFLAAFAFVLLVFACGTASLRANDPDFATIPAAARAFLQIFLGMASSEQYEHLAAFPVLFSVIVVFVFVSTVYMINLLIAQISCAYRMTFEDMLGWARLRRGAVCVSSLASVPRPRWDRFVASLQLDTPCEFGEGDVGMPGTVQTTEPANLHSTTEDAIRRFGGSTLATAQWPEEEVAAAVAEDRLEKFEKLLRKMSNKLDAKSRGHSGQHSSSGAGSSMSSSVFLSGSSKGSEHSSGE